MQKKENSVRLRVNGEDIDFPGGSLEALLDHFGMERKAVVAEVNGAIVAQADFSTRLLAEGDIVELVRFVGGG